MTLRPVLRRPCRLASTAGLSLAEITVILSVLSVLGATLTPALGDYVSDARMTKAQDDVRMLATALGRLTFDVGERQGGPLAGVDLLAGPGLPPGLGTGGEPGWLGPDDGAAVAPFDDHLLTNKAGHPVASSVGLLRHGWRGPYVGTPIGPDPWGRRYAVNIGARSQEGRAILVISAGKNGVIETPVAAAYPQPGGDDVVALVTMGGL